MPLVSIIIPAFNAMKYLPQTLDSVWEQTFTDFEVLVINDGSSDDIAKWFQSQNDPRLQLISQETQGLAGARNTGVFHSEGKYISFLEL